MKRVFLLTFIILLIPLLFSCDNGSVDDALDASAPNRMAADTVFGVIIPDENGGPSFRISSSLTADPGAVAYSFKYKAEPLFELGPGISVYGTALEWRDFEIGDIFKFAQGNWHFTIAAFDSSDHILMQGECETYIKAGTNIVDIDLALVSGTGSVYMNITIPQVSQEGGHMTVTYTLAGGASEVFTDFDMVRSNGILTFTGTLSDLEAGFYTLAFTFGDEYVGYHYGEIITVEVLKDHQSNIFGEFTSGNLLLKGKTTVLEGDLSNYISFLCGSTGTNYDWYVDGVLVHSGSDRDFLYLASTYGTYEISCVVDGDTASPAVCNLKVIDSITISLHYNDVTQVFKTYSGITDIMDLPALSDLYDGYWYDAPEDGSGGGGSAHTSVAPFTTDMDLYAHRKWITVNFDGNNPSYDGSTYTASISPSSVSGYKGEVIGILPEASVNHSLSWVTFVLDGWGTAASGGDRVHEHTALTENTTYYAQWVTVPTTIFGGSVDDGDDSRCTVTFVIRDSGWSLETTTVDTQIVPTGGYLEIPKVSLESGKAFRGWYGSALGALFDWNNKWDFTKPVTTDMTLYGEWSSSSSVFKVTYNTDGGTLDPSSINVLKGESAPKPEDPVKDGCIFGGWYKDSGRTQLFDFNKETITGNTTIYALWYNELEYIANEDGKDAYFVIPFTPNEKTGVEIKFHYGGGHSRTIFGSSDFRIRGNSIYRIFEADYGTDTYEGFGNRYDEGAYVLQLCNYHGFRIDGVPCEAVTSQTFNDDVMCVFRDNISSESAHGKCYYLKIYYDQTLIAHLLPCERPSDGKIGMFDILNDTFYSSVNEYEFTAP